MISSAEQNMAAIPVDFPLLHEIKYISCPKVENFEKFQKSLKCCSFINNKDIKLRLDVC